MANRVSFSGRAIHASKESLLTRRFQAACAHHRPSARLTAVATTATAVSEQVSPSRAVSPVKLDPEVKARHKRPAGWKAPGPQPYGNPSQDPLLEPQHNETLSYLTGDWRIFQLQNGHRWSMDDMMTAYVALQEAAKRQQHQVSTAQATAAPNLQHDSNHTLQPSSAITSTLDIGCGIGSVLLMVAWGLRRMHMEQKSRLQPHLSSSTEGQQQQQQVQDVPFSITSLGIEAQKVSYQLAQRSVRYNLGPEGSHSVQVTNADLRTGVPRGQFYDLITGTPPYIPQGAGGRSVRPQKEPCCLEVRGGIEDYCAAAAAALAPGGVFVACMGLQGQPAQFKGRRTQLAAAAAGLVVVRQVTVVTREGKLPLFAVYVMRNAVEVLQLGPSWLREQQQQHAAGQYAQQQQQQPADTFAQQVASGQLHGVEELFVVQYADGRHTEAWHAAREAMGLPPLTAP